ncbi:hypothetical protein NXC12_CH03992 [Rhizobium etli]|uniref:Uncharacterized protein n=1 Tax=Rhizobium etli TaxID=29449 RepID=A0AAN1BIM3_RHIET|nr:hypothetical protein NXC12_CH03992 [Rhizobium etli]
MQQISVIAGFTERRRDVILRTVPEGIVIPVRLLMVARVSMGAAASVENRHLAAAGLFGQTLNRG